MSSGLYRVFDAAYPPSSAPPGFAAVLGYVGGQAVNVWRPQQWLPFAPLRQFPCWPVDYSLPAGQTAAQAVTAVGRLGWAAHADIVRAIVFDLETTINAPYWDQVAADTAASGFVAVAYGSLSTILGNAAADLWVADWDSDAELEPWQTAHAHQYLPGQAYGGTVLDYSVMDDWLFERGGRGARHA